MSVYLKVKIKSLAEEARIIRREERKSIGFSRHVRDLISAGVNDAPVSEGLVALGHYHGLHHHRSHTLRTEARAAQLAYGFLRGRDLLQLEPGLDQHFAKRPRWDRVERMVHRYYEGGLNKDDLQAKLSMWVSRASIPPSVCPSWAIPGGRLRPRQEPIVPVIGDVN